MSVEGSGSGIHSFDREHPKAMPEHLEAGTMNVYGIAGLGGALDYLKKKGNKGDFATGAAIVKTAGRTDQGDSRDSSLW